MKVSELNFPELDYWVAKAESVEVKMVQIGDDVYCHMRNYIYDDERYDLLYSPSTVWGTGGPIIEREDIETGIGQQSQRPGFRIAVFNPDEPKERWANCHGHLAWAEDKQILLAAMRAYCVSKFGEEVNEDNH